MPRIRTSTSKSDDETSALANTSVEVSTKAEAEPRDHLETSVTETAVKNNGSTGDATAGPPSTDSDAVVQPKKRAREDDDASIQQGDTKKLDTKGEEQ